MISLIKINNLNKYYNKSKNNEIHVINDANLELPSTGLVCFIGKSGSGKTTLLNTIGGLDKANSGSIFYDDLDFNKYNMHTIDCYRKNNIGYVFQNYLLLENKSIYDNLRIALEVIGVYDEIEQQKRIEYVLKSVGLFKYRKKLASKLSGGQQQRVSIARCLLKECKIIIADEPTGNLDSENTVEIMNILKKISQKTLVLVVTHNKDVASFYADRIIELKDGSIISDTEGENKNELNIQNDRKIYLQDLNQSNIENNGISFSIYKDDSIDSFDLKVVVKNGTIFLESTMPLVIARQSNVELIDDHYKHLEQNQIKDYDFDISFYNNDNKNNVFKLFFQVLKKSFISFFNVRKKEKVFHVFFFFIGVFLAVCAILYKESSYFDDSGYSSESNVYCILNTTPKYYGSQYVSHVDIDNIIDNNYISKIYDGDAHHNLFSYKYNSSRTEEVIFTTYYYPLSKVSSNKYLAINNDIGNVVVSKNIADKILSKVDILTDYSSLIGLSIGDLYEETFDFVISGVIDSNANSLYFDDFFYYYKIFSNPNYSYSESKFNLVGYRNAFEVTITSGRDIENEFEILSNETFAKINDRITYGDNTYLVVGLYSDLDDYKILANSNEIIGCTVNFQGNSIAQYLKYESVISNSVFDYEIDKTRDPLSRDAINDNEIIVDVNSNFNIGEQVFVNGLTLNIVGYFKSKDMSTLNCFFIANNNTSMKVLMHNVNVPTFEIVSNAKANISNQLIMTQYECMRLIDYNYSKDTNKIIFILAIILFAISVIYIYFSTRSRMISQIKDIGVYRSIGATRMSIIKKYIADIFTYTTLTTLLGYVITIVIYSLIDSKMSILLSKSIYLPIGAYLLGVLVLYLVNIIFGIIPVLNLLRKTPAEINAKYDI